MTPEEQKKLFDEQGYLIVENLLDEEELKASREEIRRLHLLAARLQKENDPGISHFQLEPYARDSSRDGLPTLRKIENTRHHSDLFRDLAAHPSLVPVVQNLLGEDLLLFRSTLMLKPAFHGSPHALHQDSAYWPMEPPKLITVSIALDDATPANGCINVIPGSHLWPLQKWRQIALRQDAPLTEREDIDLTRQIAVPLKAGAALLFHSLLVHGSGPNTTPDSRNTALYAYFSPSVRYVPGANDPATRSFPVVAGLDGRSEFTFTATPGS